MISRVWSFCLRSRKEEERVQEEDKRTYSNESSQLRNGTKANERSNPERSKQHNKQPSHKHGMMHNQVWCMSGLKRHGMARQSAQTTVQIKWSSICNELHIDETPRQLFSSLSFMYPTILNVVKHGKRVKQMKTTYLGKLKWGRRQQTTIPENPHMHTLRFGTVLP